MSNTPNYIRRLILERALATKNNGAHIAPSLSIVEIMYVLFNLIMKNSHDNRRDRVILSKGHGALGMYAAMYAAGLINQSDFESFEVNGGAFPGQPSKNLAKGIEYSGGSLGLGLSYAIGLNLSKEGKQLGFRTYTILGDGELNEGSVWEAAMFAGYQKLNNVAAIVDYNRMQSDGFTDDILNFDIAGMWKACGWEVVVCDGHDTEALKKALLTQTNKPLAVIAQTVKGKGVSFMENNREWHHGRLSEKQFALATAELGE